MLTIGKRLERITEKLAADDCLCASQSKGGPVEIVVVQPGWTEEQIREEELAKQVECPVHGKQWAPTLRLVGSDVGG